jgi:hypothetical protein
MSISRLAQKEIRSYCLRHKICTSANLPIETIDSGSPKVVGNSWHYETNGGKYIYHPSAYSKIGWSNMRYIASTKRIQVGKDWISKLEKDLLQLKYSKELGRLVHRTMIDFIYNFM